MINIIAHPGHLTYIAPVGPSGVSGSVRPTYEETMRLNRETDYALQGLAFLARQGHGAVLQLADIASAQGIPTAFLSKIFQKLVRYGLLRSYRGSLRGYSLGRAADDIRLREILDATEGPDLFARCAFWNDTCGGKENPCALHELWKKARALLQDEVEAMSLGDLTRRWDSGAPRPMPQTATRVIS